MKVHISPTQVSNIITGGTHMCIHTMYTYFPNFLKVYPEDGAVYMAHLLDGTLRVPLQSWTYTHTYLQSADRDTKSISSFKHTHTYTCINFKAGYSMLYSQSTKSFCSPSTCDNHTLCRKVITHSTIFSLGVWWQWWWVAFRQSRCISFLSHRQSTCSSQIWPI